MPVVLICAPSSLEDELNKTLLWRADMERHEAMRQAALAKAEQFSADRIVPMYESLYQEVLA